MMQARVEKQVETGRIRLPERFDLMTTVDFRMPFVRLLSDGSVRRLVVNFSEVNYVDSMGIGTLISWDRFCKDRDKALVLERCEPHVRRIFKHAGVGSLFRYS